MFRLYRSLSRALLLLISLPLLLFSITSVSIADTLSIIQAPLINIPSIAIPGDSISIDVLLKPDEQLVFLTLQRGEREIELPFKNGRGAPFASWTRIRAKLPDAMLYGAYDIKVYSDSYPGTDLSKNALYVIPEFKEKYTFIQVTDTHLPTHKFWGDAGVDTDSSEMKDFREVIRDINIINPAFVLHTGDLINDGELEALGIPAISRAKKILGELEVPLFMVPGNHDLGGWKATPAPDGTARRYWWKYFGWQALNNTAANAVNTQNYVFHYGKDAYIGLESYVNYDRWREEIYGYQGFTDTQLHWLSSTLAANQDAEMKVLFYHYDFENQLNLKNLAVDAAFWGHRHMNMGKTNVYPLDLGTAAVCKGKRWYRVVKVENHRITGTWSIQAGNQGETIQEIYSPDGQSVTLINNSPMDFEDCLVKFTLQEGKGLLSLDNAVLYQIDSISNPKIVYALTDLPANSRVQAFMESEDIPETSMGNILPQNPEIRSYPNPFNPYLQIRIDLPTDMRVRMEILNLKGERKTILANEDMLAGSHERIWDAANYSSGLYLIHTETSKSGHTRHFLEKCLLIK